MTVIAQSPNVTIERQTVKNRRILIVTQPDDIHGYAVHEALKLKGLHSVIWFTSNFPSQATESVHIHGQKQSLKISGPEINFKNIERPFFDVIWHRRPTYYVPDDLLHPADRKYANAACRFFRNSLLRHISTDAFCVNPANSEARCHKMLQQVVASNRGFTTPETLYSNSPQEIRSFIRNQGGMVMFKSINPPYMWEGADKAWQLHTSTLREDQLVDDEILMATPAMYQAQVSKDYELRVTVIGQHVFSAKLHSQSTEAGRTDWRRAHDELKIEAHDLDPQVSDSCRRILDDLGIVFGCFDFIVTPEGDHVFLEVNQMGQFLFVERHTRQPLLDAFCELLIQARFDFEWRQSDSSVRYLDLFPLLEKKCEEAHRYHVLPQREFWDEDLGKSDLQQ